MYCYATGPQILKLHLPFAKYKSYVLALTNIPAYFTKLIEFLVENKLFSMSFLGDTQ